MSSKWLDSPSRRPEHAGSGRYALVPPAPVSPTAVTRPEMPAVRVPITYLDADEDAACDTERITQFSEAPVIEAQNERFVLLRLDGVDAGRVIQLGKQPFSIGRHTTNELQLQDAGVSRTHARVTWREGAHVLEDLGSSNGTFVFGKAVKTKVLSDGDLLQLGSHACFRYTRTDEMQEKVLRQLFESSTRDALTNAYNRRHFDERLRAELAYAARHRTDLSLLIFDIDYFKRVNDTHGHVAGDAVLRHVAHVTARQLRNEDVFARYGGEEFAILLRGIALGDAVRVAERVRTTVEALPAGFEGNVICVTVSLGCASLGESPGRDPADLIRIADERLYVAKEAGRNRVVAA